MTTAPDTFQPTTWTIQLADLIRYAWVSGDINPIHYDEKAARDLGLPGPIVHGLFAQAKLTAELNRVVREHNLGSVARSQTKFAAMMPCPGVYSIEIARGADHASLVAKVLNGEGTTCVEVRAQLR